MNVGTPDREKKFKSWKQVTDPNKLNSLPESAPSANDEKVRYHVYSAGDIIEQNIEGRAGFEDIYLFDRRQELCFCSICGVVVRMGGTVHNVSVHLKSEGHCARLRNLVGGVNEELERRIYDAVSMCCFRGHPFTVVEDIGMADLVQSPFALSAVTAKRLCVATGMATQRVFQEKFHQRGRKIIAAYMLVDGWSRKMNSKKYLASRLRVLYDDGEFEEHLVALTPYDGSRENAETLAAQIHRIAQFYGVEAVLKVILTDSPSVTLAAVNLYNKWRRAHGLPIVEHVLCLIHLLNLVCRAVDKALLDESDAWRKAHELVKAVRSSHIRDALELLGSDVTVIDVPNEIRWHHRAGCMEKLGQAAPFLIRLVENPPAELAVTSREFAAKLMQIRIEDVDELRELFAELKPIVEFFVKTFRVPIKKLEYEQLYNCAQHAYAVWRDCYRALEGAHSTMGVDVAPAARAGMRKHKAIVDRLLSLGVDMESVALGEAILCPETLKCFETWLEKVERERARAILIARLDATTCGTGLPIIATSVARRVGTRPGDLVGSYGASRKPRSPSPITPRSRAAIEQQLRCEAPQAPNPSREPTPYSVVPIEGHPGEAEVDVYMDTWKKIAAHEQAVLEGKCVDAGKAPDVSPADSLAFWSDAYAKQRRQGGLGRLEFIGMTVSAKPSANGDVEAGFSRLKNISDLHRQHMRVETLQSVFIANESANIADPELHILIRRYIEARQTRASSVFGPPALQPGMHPAEYFVWEERDEFLKPIGRIREATPGGDPADDDGEVVVDDLIEWLREIEAAEDPPIDLSADEFKVGDVEDDDVVDEEALAEKACAEAGEE
jgi:hypothetical protein